MNRRFVQIIHLKPEHASEYIRLHAEVWPGVLNKIKECHLSNYSIFEKDNLLVAYFEYSGQDFAADMQKMAEDEETQRWWALVKPLMEPVENREEGEFWADMKEIFHLK